MIITIGSTLKDDKGKIYVLDDMLGSGGFGNVYKAHGESDGTEVAVKLLQNTFDNDEAYLSFQKETNQSKLIDSENVIQYLFIHDGKLYPEYPPYIIMDYTDGGTLRQFIDRQNGKQIDNDTLKGILFQLANGMKAISEHLVHRDIKPENILNFNGVFKITDFGLSKIAGDSTKTFSFKNGGTLYYIAPEAWNNDKNTIQMDIYSMGIVFYELATLSYPYNPPTIPDAISCRNMHLFDTVIKPSEKNPKLSPSIESMIIKMLEKPTQNRYKNWDEIIAALGTKQLPLTDISAFVSRAVSNRNERDLEQQRQQSEKRKAESEREDYTQFIYSQFYNTILVPIKEFAEGFNLQYVNGNKLNVIEKKKPTVNNQGFLTEITLTGGTCISIEGEILFKEKFTKRVQNPFGDIRTINYIPQCKGKDILLWCQIDAYPGYGFNVLLVKNDSSIYGDWFILENTVNPLSRTNRKSPFGFTLSELPKEINNIGVMHIYNINLTQFSIDKILKFIADRV